MFIGDAECVISNCNVSKRKVNCKVPGQADGNYRLRITFARSGDAGFEQSQLSSINMIFVVSSVVPTTGSYGGGTPITLTGSGLDATTFDARLCGLPLTDCTFNENRKKAFCKTPFVNKPNRCKFVFRNDAVFIDGHIFCTG
mgnify:CR=1 FL=1